MRTLTTTALAVTLTGAGLVTVAGQEPASRLALNIMAMSATTDASELRLLDAQVDALVRTDALVLASHGSPTYRFRVASMRPLSSTTRACRCMAGASPGNSPMG